MQMCLKNGLVQQRLRFPRSRRPAEQPIFRSGIVKFFLAGEWLIFEFVAKFAEVGDTCLLLRFVGLGTHKVSCSLQDPATAVARLLRGGGFLSVLAQFPRSEDPRDSNLTTP